MDGTANTELPCYCDVQLCSTADESFCDPNNGIICQPKTKPHSKNYTLLYWGLGIGVLVIIIFVASCCCYRKYKHNGDDKINTYEHLDNPTEKDNNEENFLEQN